MYELKRQELRYATIRNDTTYLDSPAKAGRYMKALLKPHPHSIALIMLDPQYRPLNTIICDESEINKGTYETICIENICASLPTHFMVGYNYTLHECYLKEFNAMAKTLDIEVTDFFRIFSNSFYSYADEKEDVPKKLWGYEDLDQQFNPLNNHTPSLRVTSDLKYIDVENIECKSNSFSDVMYALQQRYMFYPYEVTGVLNFDENFNATNFSEISVGTVNSTSIHCTKALNFVMLSNAKYSLFFHNHPSGKTKRSDSDWFATMSLSTAFSKTSVTLLDSCIFGSQENACFSFLNDKIVSFKDLEDDFMKKIAAQKNRDKDMQADMER